MSISLYSGTPGSGKSLHSAKDIIEWFHKGKPVITNFDVDLSPYPKAIHTCVEDYDLTPEYLAEYSRNFFGDRKVTKKDEETILLVIDECQLMFNSREYQKKDRKTWIKFFTQHRKFGYHVILIAQMDKMLDKQIRGVIEYEYIHRKLSNYGKAGKVVTLLTAGDIFTAVQMWYPLKLKVGNQMFRAKKKYYSLYDSYATFGDKKLPSADQSAPVLAQEETAAAALDPALEVKPAEVIQDKPSRLPFRLPKIQKRGKPEKQPRRRSSPMLGDYIRPYNKPTLVSFQGKYLLPGGRSETGWSRLQQNNA